MYTDETGEALLTLLIVGFLVGAFAQIINTAITTELNNGTHNWREYLVNGLVGGVTGMLSAINPLAGLVGGFTSGFVGDVTKQLWIENKSWTEVNFGKAAVLGAVNGVFGLISGGLLQPWGAALTSDVVAGLAIGTIVFGTAWGMSQMPFDYLVSKTFA